MKLHNLLLTAALFLTAGAAFAKPHDQKEKDSYIPTDHPYTWTNAEKKSTVEVTLTKFQGQEGFKYAVYDTTNSSALIAKFNELKEAVENNNDIPKEKKLAAIVEGLHEAGYQNVWLLNEPAKGNGKNESSSAVTVISGTKVEEFGVIEFNHSVFSDKNSTNNYFFYTNSTLPANSVYFGKTYTDSGHGNDTSAMVTFTVGKPLPTPIATLLIALGFGAAFVMYRNRKQAKA